MTWLRLQYRDARNWTLIFETPKAMLYHSHHSPPWPSLILHQLIHKASVPIKQLSVVGQHLLSDSFKPVFPKREIESDYICVYKRCPVNVFWTNEHFSFTLNSCSSVLETSKLWSQLWCCFVFWMWNLEASSILSELCFEGNERPPLSGSNWSSSECQLLKPFLLPWRKPATDKFL